MLKGTLCVTGLLICVSSVAGAQPAATCSAETINTYVPPETTSKGIFYFPWHHASAPCSTIGATNPTHWCSCYFQGTAKAGAEPEAGLYASSNQTVTNAHMATIAGAGIEVVGVEWGGADHVTGLNMGTVRTALASQGSLRFVILFDPGVLFPNRPLNLQTDTGGNWSDIANGIFEDFRRFAQTEKSNFFGHSQYLRYNNRPVVYFYTSRALVGGSTRTLTAFFNELHSIAQAATAGFCEPVHRSRPDVLGWLDQQHQPDECSGGDVVRPCEQGSGYRECWPSRDGRTRWPEACICLPGNPFFRVNV